MGGLTVFKALRTRLPRESLIYFGDTAHLPYGSKSREAVTRFSLEIGRFLESQGIKLLVVACNTASSLALGELKKALKVPVLGVLEPGVRAAVHATRNRGIGIIGTEATVESQSYPQALRALLPDARIFSQACPLLVPLVEEGWWNHEVTRRVAAEYLKPLKAAALDTVILGCTHYPVLKATLQKMMGPRVTLVDSAEAAALDVDQMLAGMGLKAASGEARHRFFASDGPDRFLKLARRFLGKGSLGAVQIHRFD